MPDSLAIASVTRALAALLAEVAEEVPGARVTTLSPESEALAAGDPGINLWLLSAVPGAAPRSAAPALVEPGITAGPLPLALTLSYLIGFYGDNAQFDSQRLLAAAAAEIHFRAQLDPGEMAGALRPADPAPRPGGFIPPAPQPVALRLVPADAEAIGRAWPGGPGASRALALLCAAGPVILHPPSLPPLPFR